MVSTCAVSPLQAARFPWLNTSDAIEVALHTHRPGGAPQAFTFESVQGAIPTGSPAASGLPSSFKPSQSSSLPLQISLAQGCTVASLSSQSLSASQPSPSLSPA